MANTRSSNKSKAVTPSGTSKAKPQSKVPKPQLPKVLTYPKLLPFGSTPSIRNLFCYVIEHYGTKGLSILVYREQGTDQTVVLCGDWQGNSLDLMATKESDVLIAAKEFVQKDIVKLIQILHSIRLQQAQLFFALEADGPRLVDVQVSMNKLAGPGMVNDMFGKTYNTQKIKKIEIIDARAIEYLERGTGSYEGDIILKPSRFRVHHDSKTNTYSPLYVEVKR